MCVRIVLVLGDQVFILRLVCCFFLVDCVGTSRLDTGGLCSVEGGVAYEAYEARWLGWYGEMLGNCEWMCVNGCMFVANCVGWHILFFVFIFFCFCFFVVGLLSDGKLQLMCFGVMCSRHRKGGTTVW